jgi:hypothetical protein
MRYSIKWLLAGMVYVAIAAAAFAQPHWAYVGVLWTAAFCALAYAMIVGLFARGPERVLAVGFVITSLMWLACVQFAPTTFPISQLRALPLLMAPASQPAVSDQMIQGGAGDPFSAIDENPFDAPDDPFGDFQGTEQRNSSTRPRAPSVDPRVEQERRQNRIRAASAMTVMLVGLVGAALGAVACRRSAGTDDGE